jgi:hypothetical protein
MIDRNGTQLVQDGSDNLATDQSFNSISFDYGIVNPGQTTSPSIIYLQVPFTIGIDNIRIGIVSAGGLDFDGSLFGFSTHLSIMTNLPIQQYFNGINNSKSPDSEYNIEVPRKNRYESQYVYLYLNISDEQLLTNGNIRYKWFFDFVS